MTLDQNSLIMITLILSITVIGVIALTRNTDTKLYLKLGTDKSLTIEGKRSLPEATKVDCLPGEGNSRLLKCDN